MESSSAVPHLPSASLHAREYAVPQPEGLPDPANFEAAALAGSCETFGPYERWPLLRRSLLAIPRPVPPLNFESAPPNTEHTEKQKVLTQVA